MLENFDKKTIKLISNAKKIARKPNKRPVLPVDIFASFFEIDDETKNLLVRLNLTKEKLWAEYKKINFENTKSKEIFSKETIKIFLSSLKMINKAKEEKIMPVHILSALIKENNPLVNEILKKLEIKKDELIILSEKLIKTKALKQKRVMKLSEYKILINHKQQKLKTQALKEQYFFLLKLFRKI